MLADRIEPVFVSEHLAWSTWRGRYLPDLLPFVRTHAALARISANIACTQDALQRRISIENPTHYLHLDGHDWGEPDFLVELCRRTGCGLLLDINNVFVSAHNIGFDAATRLDAWPGDLVTEIHLAGHTRDEATTPALLIDSHDTPVADEVWELYRRVIERIGASATLIERDDNLPTFEVLLRERDIALAVLAEVERHSAATARARRAALEFSS